MKRIIYIFPAHSSFIRYDEVILKSAFNVNSFRFRQDKKWLTAIGMLKQFFVLLKYLPTSDGVVTAFAGYHSFLPIVLGRVFNVPVFTIMHGTCSCAFPEIGYGSLRKPLLAQFIKFAFTRSKALFPVSNAIMYTENRYYKEHMVKQGVLHHFPKIKTPYHVIHHSFDDNFWIRLGKGKDDSSFCTIAMRESVFQLKGIDLILKVAQELVENKFYILGMDRPKSLQNILPNVHFTGNLKAEELREYYSRCRFYLQLSISEGFGCALSEAMLCQCIPIVSNVNKLPEFAEEIGYILPKRDPGLLLDLLKRLPMDSGELEKKGLMARERIRERYPKNRRKELLCKTLESYI